MATRVVAESAAVGIKRPQMVFETFRLLIPFDLPQHELVTDSAAERARLGKSQVMGIGRPSSAQKAGLRRYELQMHAIAVATRFAVRKSTFVDMPGDGIVHTQGCGGG
jgi:hypothetical protein